MREYGRLNFTYFFKKERKIPLSFMSYCHCLPTKHFRNGFFKTQKSLQARAQHRRVKGSYFTCAIAIFFSLLELAAY